MFSIMLLKFNFFPFHQGTEYVSGKKSEDDDEDTEGLDDDDADVVIASLVAPQPGGLGRQQQIGWLCGEPMPDYAHVVFKSTR